MEILEKKLSEVAEIIAGQSPPSSTYNKNEIGLPFYQGKADFGEMFPIPRNWCSKPTKTAKHNDILMSVRAPVGPVNINQGDSCIGRGISAIRVKPGYDYKYLFYYLKSNQRLIERYQTGSTFKAITQSNLKKLKLFIPKSLTDQKRISKVLSDCEQLIAWRKESILLLDDYLESVFLEMFGERKGKPMKLETLIDIQNGQVDPRIYPYSEMYHVGGANIESNTGKLVNVKKAKEEKLVSGKYLFDSSYILYSKIRPYLNKITIPPYEGICSADIYPIKPKPNKDLDIHFLKFELKSARFLAYAARNSGRANIPKINRKALNNYKVQLPKLEDQLIFKKKALKAEELKLVLTSSLKELENLYSSLSQRAFKGELDLSKVILDEEAEPTSSSSAPPTHKTKPQQQLNLKEVATKQQAKRDIRNLSLLDYFEVPAELYQAKVADDYSPELDFIKDDLFYQFYLKDHFAEQPFTFSDLQQKFNSYYIPKGQDFDPQKWKTMLYQFMDGKQPLVEQIFEEKTGTIKLKLTNEAFKA